MSILEIVKQGHSNFEDLRRPTELVDVNDICSKEIQTLIDDMIETTRIMNGAGCSANQVDLPLRICVVESHDKAMVLINPELYRSNGSKVHVEGCLSIPGMLGNVKRKRNIWVRSLNRYGSKQVFRDISGRFGHVIQHEINHLDGKLYIDLGDDYRGEYQRTNNN